MEKNKLYKVNKWNKPAFEREENVFWPGGEIQLTAPRIFPYVDWSNPFQRAAAIGTSAGQVNGFSSMANTTNPFNNSGTATAQPTKGSALTGILGAVGGTAGNMLGSAIGGGYSTGGVGEGVAGIGNTIGGAMQMIPGVGTLAGTAVQFASGLIGGAINRGWGVKENKENVAAIKQNTSNARMMGNALAGVTDSKGFFDTAGEMTTGSGFSAGDLYKDGWFTSKGTRQGNALINKENNALAFQRHGMVTGAENVDSIMDDNVFSNFAAFGGYVPTIGAGTEDMPAINFGMWQDWLTGLNKRRKQASDNREANDYTNIGMGMRYDFGGDMQTNSADFPTGLTHVNAGGTHEESPYDGVQMGVDPEGTPNLVEEGEAIWNDYVFSNRIELDEEAKKIFHFPKKTKLTYADAAKRLEKEISERPNDPISKAGFKVQMQQLEEQQERQKQEMEAERAKAAFEALSPEEQVAVMENAAQQEQMAQEQAMAAEQANMPGTEPMMAEGQAGVPSQEEMAMMQQQGQPEVVEGEPVMAAYGGNLFDEGGYKGALAWLNKNQPNLKNKEAIAKVMAKRAKVVAYRGSDENNKVYNFGDVFKGLSASTHRRIGDSNDELFRSLVNDGMPRELAFEYAYPETLGYPYNGAKYASEHAAARDAAYQRMITNPQQAVSAAMPSSNRSIFTSASDIVNNAVARAGAQQQTTPVVQPQATIATAALTPEEKRRAAAYWAAAEAPYREQVEREVAARKAAAQSTSAEAAPAERVAAPVTRAAEPAVNAADKGINVGKWRQAGNHWDEYGLPGLQNYLIKSIASLQDPDLTDEQQLQRRQNIVDTLNGIQESYYNNIVPTLNKNRQLRSDDVANHQTMYQNATNNAGFFGVDEDGRYYNKMDMALEKPEGHNTTDNLATGWVDGYSGPQTWLRHMGASGDSLNDVVKQLKDIGIDYSPYNNWTVGEGDNARQLYRASLIGSPNNENGDKSFTEEYPMIARPAETTDKKQSVAGQYGAPWAPENAGNTTVTPAGNAADTAGSGNDKKIVPNLRPTWMRYAGLLGPAVGLGLMAAGVGRPDTSVFDSVLEGYDRRGIGQMEPRYIGNYLRYSPMDIWFEQNRLNANSRATDRSIANSGANQGSKIAGMLANAYNNQIASGDLYRKALEYNDAKRHQVADFNRATDMFNAQAYNQAQQFNASARNADRGLRAQLGMQAAAQKADMDAGWYNSLYGNIGALTRGIADIGRENYNHNMLARLAASGALPGIVPGNNMDDGLVRYGAHGGKLKKKKKRGLTC